MADALPIIERETIGIASPFVPPEWIAAHGFRPRRLGLAGPAGEGPLSPPGGCPFPEVLMAELALVQPRGTVFAGNCDQLRRSLEDKRFRELGPTLLLHVPHTWEEPGAQRLYRDELRRLGRFLVALGGREPDREELRRTMAAYDLGRRRLLEARPGASGRAWSACVAEYFLQGGPEAGPLPEAPPPAAGPRLALLGGPLWGGHRRLIGLLEERGARVVLDGTEAGERGFPPPFDPGRLAEDPFLELGEAYFGGLPDAFRRPNSLLYRWLDRELSARRVQALVLVRCLWCDPWHGEARRLREWTGLPMVEVEVTGDAFSESRVETRLMALLEVLG